MQTRIDRLPGQSDARHAESADARPGVRREERENSGGKNPEKRKEDPAEIWQDRTDMSVQALRLFLEGLLREAAMTPESGAQNAITAFTAPSGNAAGETDSSAAAGATFAQKTDMAAVQAANAYRNSARTSSAPLPPAQPAAPSLTGGLSSLSTEELRAIGALIAQLAELEKKNVGSVAIMRGDTFLQSLIDSVAKAIANEAPV
jgi:hypothetical protein